MTSQPSPLDLVLAEDERQEKLLVVAMAAADVLAPATRRRLFRHLKMGLELETKVGHEAPKPKAASTTNGKKAPPSPEPSDDTSFLDKAEALVLAKKTGITTREVADTIGQKYRSADGTLRHIASVRKTIEKIDHEWFPVDPNREAVPREVKLTIRRVITQVFEKNGNKPLAAKDVFAAAALIKPDLKKGSVDAELVLMRQADLLVQNGTSPQGGGLYHLVNGGAQTASAN
jgi:hypothetical protein